MSSRANIPARRPVSTISPATAFCNSLRQATVVKSAARSTAQRSPRQRLLHSLCPPADPGGQARCGARSQTEASASRCAGNQTTEGNTVAPPVKGANCWRCSTPFCSTHTTVSAEHRAVSQGDGLRLGGFHRDKDQVEGGGYRRWVGVHRAGHHDLALVRCAAPAPNGRYARRPSAPSHLKQGGGDSRADGAGTNKCNLRNAVMPKTSW